MMVSNNFGTVLDRISAVDTNVAEKSRLKKKDEKVFFFTKQAVVITVNEFIGYKLNKN